MGLSLMLGDPDSSRALGRKSDPEGHGRKKRWCGGAIKNIYLHDWCSFDDLKTQNHHWGSRVSPVSYPNKLTPQVPTTDPPSPAADDPPPGDQLCSIFFNFNGFTPLWSSFQWGSALSTLGRISIVEYKTPQQKFLCSIAENFVEHNVRFTSCIFKVALHGYAGRPDRWLLPSPAPRNLFCGSWCRWGKCFFDVTKIRHARWYDGFDWFFEVIFDGFPVNSARWVFVHCPAAQYRYSGCWSHQSLNHFDVYIRCNSLRWKWS